MRVAMRSSSRVDGMAYRCSKAQIRSRSPATRHGYYNPWPDMNTDVLQTVLTQVCECAETISSHEWLQPEFARIHGATEHVPACTVRTNVNHYLGQITRGISQIVRAVVQGEALAFRQVLGGIQASARHVLNIRCDGDKEHIQHSLCDFMKCRCDADAVAIVKETLLTTESGGSNQPRTAGRLARDLMSAMERDLALSLIHI